MTENDEQIVELSKREYCMKRELACLKDQWRKTKEDLSDFNKVFLEDEGWTMLQYDRPTEEVTVDIPADRENQHRRTPFTATMKDTSLHQIVKMGQRIVELTKGIAETKRQLSECLKKGCGEGDD